MSKVYSQSITESAQNGIDTAKKILEQNGITEKVKQFEDAIYNDAVQARYDAAISNLQKVTSNIQANSNKLISDIKNDVESLSIENKKFVNTDTLKIFNKDGVACFKDAGGKLGQSKDTLKWLLLLNQSKQHVRRCLQDLLNTVKTL